MLLPLRDTLREKLLVRTCSVRPLVLLLSVLLALALIGLGQLIATRDTAELLSRAGHADFIAYWAAGRLNLIGSDPYNADALFVLEKANGWHQSESLLIWTLPFTLTIVMPFGMLDFVPAFLLWLCMNVILLIGIAYLLWQIYGGPSSLRGLAPLITFLFVPTIMQLCMGQMGILILAGLAGFLFFVRQERWWLAGAMLPLVAIKPHVAYLFWVMLALWWLHKREWRIIGGALVSGGIAWLIPVLVNPEVNQQYITAALTTPPLSIGPTTWGTLLRYWLGWEFEWLAFIPPLFGLVLFGLYWQHRAHTSWTWTTELPWLLLLSTSTMAFGWYHDFVILLPAVIQMLVWIIQSASHRLRWAALSGFIAYEATAYLVLRMEQPYAVYYVWMAPVLLIAYWWLRRYVQQNGAQVQPVAVAAQGEL